MLILTRHIDQGVRIYDAEGHYVGHVKVLGIERDRVKLGFDADPRFVFLRDELLETTREGTVTAMRRTGDAGAPPTSTGLTP